VIDASHGHLDIRTMVRGLDLYRYWLAEKSLTHWHDLIRSTAINDVPTMSK
jgi:hypothetical protein